MDKKEFGIYLTKIREKSGFKSQRQLALAAGISPATLSRIESGSQEAKPPTLKKISKHLKDISYDELMEAAGYIETRAKILLIDNEAKPDDDFVYASAMNHWDYYIPGKTEINFNEQSFCIIENLNLRKIRDLMMRHLEIPDAQIKPTDFIVTYPQFKKIEELTHDLKGSKRYSYNQETELTDKDEKDVAKRMDKLRNDLTSEDGLMFNGEPMSEEAKESFLEAMEYAFRQTQRINKKYIPKKYRKDKD
ncbi:helix-turn-helix transcriptional regulator [Desertibacillus haloalkaliphilus]|nr:helix-turn-helix transcriptional regulator [Desertibacillus haloalkaliphilus]